MATPVNIRQIGWKDSTTAKDQNGQTIPWDANTDRAGIQISFDGVAAVSVPLSAGVTTLDPRTVAAYQALPVGSHSFTLAEVTKEGIVGEETGANPFLVAVVPAAPTEVVVA